MTENKPLNVTQAARELGVHPQTLRAWTNKGLIPHTRLPSGTRRFTQEQIDHIRESMLRGVDKDETE